MKILIPVFHFAKSGGMRVLVKLANEWNAKGNQVTFLVADDSESYFPIDDGINVINLSKIKVKNKNSSMINYLISNYENYDIVLANLFITAYYVFVLGVKKKSFKKCYYYIQAYEPEFYSFKGRKQIYKKIVSWFSYFLPLKRVVNSEIYFKYKNLRSNKVVHPGLDLDVFWSKDIYNISDKIKVGCIGRTEEWKGTQDVCDAVEILRNENIDVDFYIAFNDFNTTEHFFVKPDGDKNLASFYRQIDVLVAPGHIQLGAIHYPVIEAMACGTSVITTGYYPACDDNSYIVPVKNPNEIAKAIKSIINDKDRAVMKRHKGIEDIKQFAWDMLAEQFIVYFKEGC